MALWIALGGMFVVVLVALFRGDNIRPMTDKELDEHDRKNDLFANTIENRCNPSSPHYHSHND